MMLRKISEEIREILDEKRKSLDLSFIEEDHIYYMRNLDGEIRNDFPSVSKVMKLFYEEFDSEGISFKKAKGDLEVQQQLLKEWKGAADYSVNMGSRVHYFLEKRIIERFGDYKDVRQPIFECDFEQTLRSDAMISAGTRYIDLMVERGGELLDTEIVLGDPTLGYVGQPDKVWLFENKEKTEYGFVCSDWKTNRKKNFEASYFTKKMYSPFQKLDNTALGHYFTQLPFYCKLLLKMLEGTKYENIKFYGCIVVHLDDNGNFEEYRVPKDVINTIMDMNMGDHLKKLKK